MTNKPSCMTSCTKFLHGIPSAFILLVAFWSYFAYVVALCIITVNDAAEKVIYLIVYHILFILFTTNFMRTIFEKPQPPPQQYKITIEDFNSLIHEPTRDKIMTDIFKERNLKIRTRKDNNGVNICERCCCLKPDRAHHCSTCGQCVLKMDHHCPWVSNCVGFHNYKFFVVFLFWGSIYCSFIFGTSLKYFLNFWQIQQPTIPWTDFQILFLFIASIMFGISQLILFVYHLKLILYNQTTLESFRPTNVAGYGEREDAFHIGKINNLREVLGNNVLLWGLPVKTSRGNGHEFPMRMDDENLEDLGSFKPKI